MRNRLLPISLGVIVVSLIGIGVVFSLKTMRDPSVPPPTPSVVAEPEATTSPDLNIDSDGLSKATVSIVTSQGSVRFRLFPEEAPTTVKRVLELIGEGFYNGTAFHRVIPGFLIQGGDPTGNGTGGSGVKLKAEFSKKLRHGEGTVAMARGSDPNSADSQFYITLGPQPHIDGRYTIFGKVIEGMDVVRKIQMGDKIVSMAVE
jgi:cyclophilin family peptidyl-prolyl cis-trans isomerase